MSDQTNRFAASGEPEAARIRVPRSVDALATLFEHCARFCAAHRVDSGARGRADFILEEIFTNLVKYNPQGGGEIEVELGLAGNTLELSLTDPDADRFDPRERSEVDVGAPLGERTPGGLGIHLVKKLAKRIDYVYINRKSRLTIYLELG